MHVSTKELSQIFLSNESCRRWNWDKTFYFHEYFQPVFFNQWIFSSNWSCQLSFPFNGWVLLSHHTHIPIQVASVYFVCPCMSFGPPNKNLATIWRPIGLKWLGTTQPRRFLSKNKSVDFSFWYHVWCYHRCLLFVVRNQWKIARNISFINCRLIWNFLELCRLLLIFMR